MFKKAFFIIILVLVAKLTYAQPNIMNVSGNFSHGNSATITGSSFGTKSPALPLLWDDGTSNPSLSTYYDAWMPINAEQGSEYNMAYRDANFRNIGPPHDRINYILAGAHATALRSGQYYSGGLVGIGKNITSHEYFISYYYRIDPNFDEENNPSAADNMKEIVLSNTPGEFYPDGWGAFGYASWCVSTTPDINYTSPIILGRMPINPENQNLPYGCSGNNIVYHSNPINGWIKMQWEGDYNNQYDGPEISLTTYPDGQRTYQSHYGDGLTVAEYSRGPWANYPKENELRFIGLGGFGRVERFNNGINSFRYFAGVYIDNTHSRVMLGNNQNYGSCTIMEPQIPSAWNNGSITITINAGALSDNNTAYLFVFDSNNNRNSVGYPITLGGGAPPDTMPPAAPGDLRTENN